MHISSHEGMGTTLLQAPEQNGGRRTANQEIEDRDLVSFEDCKVKTYILSAKYSFFVHLLNINVCSRWSNVATKKVTLKNLFSSYLIRTLLFRYQNKTKSIRIPKLFFFMLLQ